MKLPHSDECVCTLCKNVYEPPHVSTKIKILSKSFAMPVEMFQTNTGDDDYEYFDWFVRYVGYKKTLNKDAVVGVMDVDAWNSLPNAEDD